MNRMHSRRHGCLTACWPISKLWEWLSILGPSRPSAEQVHRKPKDLLGRNLTGLTKKRALCDTAAKTDGVRSSIWLRWWPQIDSGIWQSVHLHIDYAEVVQWQMKCLANPKLLESITSIPLEMWMKLSPESRRWLLRTIGTLLASVVGQNSGPFSINFAIPREQFWHHLQMTENLRNPTANSEELAEKKWCCEATIPI